MSKVRRKRDSVGNIYRHCIIFGNCPKDVKNKVEQTTPADQILKYGAGGVYFGGLGIGTGKGTGGSGGYTTLGAETGSGVRVGAGTRVIRPSVPISTVDPVDILPVQPIDSVPIPLDPGAGIQPTDPSVLPGEDLLPVDPDPAIVGPPHIEPEGPGPSTEVPAVAPDVITSVVTGENTTNLIQQPRHPFYRTHQSYYDNPSFEIAVAGGAGESSDADNVFVVGGGGRTVGGGRTRLSESIELGPMRPRLGRIPEEAETSFATSTPQRIAPRTRSGAIPRTSSTRIPRLYNRLFGQVKVTDPTFLSAPERLVTFSNVIENPAFEERVSLLFDQAIDDIAAAPDRDFQDITRLSRPFYSRTPEGSLRVSRLGSRASIRTRSGVTVGPQSHFYYDISPIRPDEFDTSETIELLHFGEQTGEGVVAHGLAETGFELVNLDEVTDPVPDEDLLDPYEPIGENLTLSFSDRPGGAYQTITVPRILVRRPFLVYPEIGGSYRGYVYSDSSADHGQPPVIPADIPIVIVSSRSDDYDLHPSFLRRRKRRRLSIYV
uniref:Minor capsid protein L2 n=1 Tax=Eidolon bat papillomavirus TaxID=3141875 RepID=A0AAU7E320_9PAPI